MTPLSQSPFSRHFNILTILGAGVLEVRNPAKVNVYVVYKLLVTSVCVYGTYGLLLDLYMVLRDLKKMTWNLCVTMIFLGTITKNFQLLQMNQIVRRLRMRLHRDAESREAPEDVSINELAVRELKFLRISFYGTTAIFVPIWILARYLGYLWGIRELPIPIRLPGFVDLDDDFQFNVSFVFVACAAIFGLILAMETELAMYGILIQISREYRILLRAIPRLNDMYEDLDSGNGSAVERRDATQEVNPWLKKIKTRVLIKKFSARQKEIIEYTEAFEICYNKPLLQEFFSISVLIVALALQCLWESVDFSGHLLYQTGYLFINVVDMFLICWFSTKLRTQCIEVGEAVYATLWYRMGPEIRRDISLIIMRSQHPPKITTGKFMELSLGAFMSIMSNLYSWLALVRQLDTSSS